MKKIWTKSWQIYDKMWILRGRAVDTETLKGAIWWMRNAKPQDSLELSRPLGEAAPCSQLPARGQHPSLARRPWRCLKRQCCPLQYLPWPPLTSSKPIIRICSRIITVWGESTVPVLGRRRAYTAKELHDLDVNTVGVVAKRVLGQGARCGTGQQEQGRCSSRIQGTQLQHLLVLLCSVITEPGQLQILLGWGLGPLTW